MKHKMPLIEERVKDSEKAIYQLAKECTTITKEVKQLNPSYDSNTDVRFLHFYLMREIIQSYLLSVSLGKELLNTDWWKKSGYGNSLSGMNDEEKAKFISDRSFHYGEDKKSGFFIQSYSHIENTFRLIAKAYYGGTGYSHNISTLVKTLLKDLNFGTGFTKLWEIFAFTRNTIHNGGFHTHPDNTIIYKGKIFNFKQNKPIDFLDNNTALFLISELTKMIRTIISHPKIRNIKEIIHNQSKIEFVKKST